MNDFLCKVYDFITEKELLKEGESVLAAVSGGSDSVCLLRVLAELKVPMDLKLSVVHVNHGLRGEESDGDENFTRSLCRELDLPCHVFREDIRALARRKKLSLEEAGRDFRYKCFEELRERTGAGVIAVAHHMDDNSETVLFNLLRGSGISGLAGIPARRGRLIRPLLCLRKEEIEAWLREIGQSWREDASNQKREHSRNRLRLDLLPYIRENINSAADLHLSRTGELLSDIRDHLRSEAEDILPRISREEDRGMLISDEGFCCLDRALQREVLRLALEKKAGGLRDMGMVHTESLRLLFEKKTGSRLSLPAGLRAVKGYGGVLVSAYAEQERENRVGVLPPEGIFLDPGKLLRGECKIRAEKSLLCFSLTDESPFKTSEIPQNIYTKYFDYDKINRGLCLRYRREGDYILLRSGRKKLRRVLIDEKIPSDMRDSLPLLADGSHIMWIPATGRISEHYKLRDETGRVLRADLEESV